METPIRILIIDDDEDDFFITSDYLNQIEDMHFRVEWCYRYQEALTILSQGRFDIYFVDYRLGAKTGLDFLSEAKKLGSQEPIVLLTGKGNKTIDREAMRIGATDYLIKSELNPDKLERCIRYSLERSTSLKAIRSNEAKFRKLFEQSSDAIFIATPALQFSEVNHACSTLLGLSAKQLQSVSLYDFLDKPTADYVRLGLRESGEVLDYPMEISVGQKEPLYCILTVTGQQESGDVQGIIHDITNLKRSEKANLQIEKLAAAGRLVRTLAHEVRNPLNNINMAVEQLRLPTPDEAPVYLDIIYRNSNRIGALINQLLNSARPTEMDFREKSVQSVVDMSISEALDRITLRHINLRVNYDDQPALAMLDGEKLKLAFLNLIINAIEAMEEKSGVLDIEVRTGSREHLVKIMDNGQGIPSENLARLFEPYFTSKRNGMGLGLASTLNIVKAHSGSVEVQSEAGTGTVFTIKLPAYERPLVSGVGQADSA